MSIKNKITRSVFYCYLPIIVIFVVLRILSSYGYLKFLGPIGSYIVNAGVQIVLLFSLPVLLFSRLHRTQVKDTLKFFNFRKISLKAIIISILIGVIVYILNVFVASVFSSLLTGLGYKSSSSSAAVVAGYPIWLLFINLFVTAVLPAICEETAHRGMLLKGLSPMGRIWAIIISSLLFGLLHLNVEQVFYTTIIGLLAGYIVSVTDSIYPAMIIHFMNNAISVLMGYSSHHNLGFDFLFTFITDNISANPLLGILFLVFFIGTLLIVLKYLIKLLFRETALKNMGTLQRELFKEIAKENYLKELDDAYNGVESGPRKEVSIDFEEFNKLYQEKSMDLGQSSSLDKKLMSDFRPYRMDVVTRVLLIASVLISFAVTFLTFLWGIL